MKNQIILTIGSLCLCLLFSACDSSRTNTKREMDETYTQDGDTLDPTEGTGEGTTGHKFMETYEEDTTKNNNIEQD